MIADVGMLTEHRYAFKQFLHAQRQCGSVTMTLWDVWSVELVMDSVLGTHALAVGGGGGIASVNI